jgi:hypothetical protein
MPTSETLTLLAEAVADGRDVDWAQAESSAETEEDKKVVLQLRALARLGVLARERIESWGPLKIRGPVGSGAYGTVFRAWDARLEREVALKILHSDAALHAASTVIKEGRLLAQIRHPSVVTVHGADEFDRRIASGWSSSPAHIRDIVEQGPRAGSGAVGRDLAALPRCTSVFPIATSGAERHARAGGRRGDGLWRRHAGAGDEFTVGARRRTGSRITLDPGPSAREPSTFRQRVLPGQRHVPRQGHVDG